MNAGPFTVLFLRFWPWWMLMVVPEVKAEKVNQDWWAMRFHGLEDSLIAACASALPSKTLSIRDEPLSHLSRDTDTAANATKNQISFFVIKSVLFFLFPWVPNGHGESVHCGSNEGYSVGGGEHWYFEKKVTTWVNKLDILMSSIHGGLGGDPIQVCIQDDSFDRIKADRLPDPMTPRPSLRATRFLGNCCAW